MKQQNRIDMVTKSEFLFVLLKRIRSTYVPVSRQTKHYKICFYIKSKKKHKIPPKFSQQSAFFVYSFGIEKWYVNILVLWI